MQRLSKNQVCLIEDVVSAASIHLSHLADDLVDHICCDVENEMSRVGYSFEESFERVLQKFGVGGLRKIQEDTLLLTDKKYRFMKNSMKIIGNVSLGLIGFATIFKIMHWEGAGFLFVLGFALLLTTFFPSVIIASYRSQKTEKNLWLHISAFIGGFGFMAGSLFKMMHWPGANKLLYVGFGFFLFVVLPVLLVYLLKKSKTLYDRILNSVFILSMFMLEIGLLSKFMFWPGATLLLTVGAGTLVLVVLPWYVLLKYREPNFVAGKFIAVLIGGTMLMLFHFLLALNVSKKTVETLVISAQKTTSINNYLTRKNESLYDNLNRTNLSDSTLKNDLMELKGKVNLVEHTIFSTASMIINKIEPESDVTIVWNEPEKLNNKDNAQIPFKILTDNTGIGNESPISKINNGLADIIDFVQKHPNISGKRFETMRILSARLIQNRIEYFKNNAYTPNSIVAIGMLKSISNELLQLENSILLDVSKGENVIKIEN